jgi:beta-lactamase regulating signal transducer with metallopeptidase domain
MIPIRDTSYTSKHESAGNAAKTAPRSRVKTSRKNWSARLRDNKDLIAEAVVIISLFAVIIGAFYFGSVYGASL